MYRSIEIELNLDKLFEFIKSYKERCQGNSPTVEQMREGIGANSTSTIHRWLGWLEDDKRITRTGRNIEIPNAAWHQLTEVQVSALFFLAKWALEQDRPPLSVIGAADCVHHIGLLFSNKIEREDGRQ